MVLVYALTVWVEGLIFKEDAPAVEAKKKPKAKLPNKSTQGFGAE
ncbi:hypothetical protein SynPROSU1_01861 [Synechococcus sp. PROS-U-1]|nr:hypothetical protein SynPROSU1_01861 [Synechococcus sp. PROS-U-1]